MAAKTWFKVRLHQSQLTLTIS